MKPVHQETGLRDATARSPRARVRAPGCQARGPALFLKRQEDALSFIRKTFTMQPGFAQSIHYAISLLFYLTNPHDR